MKKMHLAVGLTLLTSLICSQALAAPAIVDSTEIKASGTIFNPTYPPSNTIDDNIDTYWHGTNNIQIGGVDYLIYQFKQPTGISRIDFFTNADNGQYYRLGELDIQISQDTTDGLDGTWTTVDHINGDFAPSQIEFTRDLTGQDTSWIRFQMEYQGRGAWGNTPAFFLSEVDFWATLNPSLVPEPTIMLLFGIGLAGLARFSAQRG